MKSKKRLTLDDRMVTQACLHDGKSISQIAQRLKVNKSTVSRELKKFCIVKDSYYPLCKKLKKKIVCNACKIRDGCHFDKRFYNCLEADRRSKALRKSSRSKTTIHPSLLRIIDRIVSEGVGLGQSLHHVYVSSPTLAKICTERTIRRLVYRGNLSVKPHQLRRYAAYKHEYQKTPAQIGLRDIRVLLGRTYKDFIRHVARHKRENIVQFDSVIGQITDQKAILTITFPKSDFQFGRLIDKGSPINARNSLRHLFRSLGNETVRRIFPVNLADNGSEFSYFNQIEFDDSGEQICRTFFTNPYRSTDKAECERNHEFVRYVIPKGKSLDFLTQDMLDDIFSNINSYVRKSKGDRTPYDLVKAKFGKAFLDQIGIRRIPNKKVKLTQLV